MPRKSSQKKSVSKNSTENYIIFILWLAIASTFILMGYMSRAVNTGATASNRPIPQYVPRNKLPTPTSGLMEKPGKVIPTTTPTPTMYRYRMAQ